MLTHTDVTSCKCSYSFTVLLLRSSWVAIDGGEGESEGDDYRMNEDVNV